MTLYSHTPCPHGFTQKHVDTYPYGPYDDGICPGGSITPLTINYEAAATVHKNMLCREDCGEDATHLAEAKIIVDAALEKL